MRCHICNAGLSDSDIQWNPLHEDWDPCSVCQSIIMEVFDDHLTEDEIDRVLAYEWPEGFLEEDFVEDG